MSGIRPLTGSSRRKSILGLGGAGELVLQTPAPPASTPSTLEPLQRTALSSCVGAVELGSLVDSAGGALQPLAHRNPSNLYEFNEAASFASSRPGTANLRLLEPVVEQELLNTASMSRGWQPTVCTRPHPGGGGEGRPFGTPPPRSAQSNQSVESFNSVENFHELAQSASSQLPAGWGLIGNLSVGQSVCWSVGGWSVGRSVVGWSVGWSVVGRSVSQSVIWLFGCAESG